MPHLLLRKTVINWFTASLVDVHEPLTTHLSEGLAAFQGLHLDDERLQSQQLSGWLLSVETKLTTHPHFQDLRKLILVFLNIRKAIHGKVLLGWFAEALSENPQRFDVIQALVVNQDDCSHPITAKKTLMLRELMPIVSASPIHRLDLITHFHNTLVDQPLKNAVQRLTSRGNSLCLHHLQLLADTASDSRHTMAMIGSNLKNLVDNILQLKPHEQGFLSSKNSRNYYLSLVKVFNRPIKVLIDFQHHPYFPKFQDIFCNTEPTPDFLAAMGSLIAFKLFDPEDELPHLLKQSNHPHFFAHILQTLLNERADKHNILILMRKLLDIETDTYPHNLQAIISYLMSEDHNLLYREIDHAVEAIHSFTILAELNIRKLPLQDPVFFQNLRLLNDSDKEDIQGYILAEQDLFKGRLRKFHRHWHLAFQADLHRTLTIREKREESADQLLKAFAEDPTMTYWLMIIQTLETEGRSRSFSLMCDGLTFLLQTEAVTAQSLVKTYFFNLRNYRNIYPYPNAALLQSTTFSPLDLHISALLTQHHPKLIHSPPLKIHPTLFIEFQTLLAESRNLVQLLPRILDLSIEPEWAAFVNRVRQLPFYQDLPIESYKKALMQPFIEDTKHTVRLTLLWGLTEEIWEMLGYPSSVSLPPLAPYKHWPSEVYDIVDAQPILWDDAHPSSDAIASQLTTLIHTARQMGFDGILRGKVMADSIRVLECLRFIRMNQRFLEFAHSHHASQDSNILSAIFSSEKDRFEHHVIRDPYNNVSIHLYQEREWAFVLSREPSPLEKQEAIHAGNILLIQRREALFMGYTSNPDKIYLEIQVDPKEGITKDLQAHPEGAVKDKLLLLKIRTLASLHHIKTPSDPTLDHIATIQQMISDLVESSVRMTASDLVIFFHKFIYENDIGCMEARIAAASEYAKTLEKNKGVVTLADVMGVLTSESLYQHPDFNSLDFDCYPAILHMAQQKGILGSLQVLVSQGTAPVTLTEPVLKSYCQDILAFDVSQSKEAMVLLSMDSKGIEKNRKRLHGNLYTVVFHNEDDALLHAEFLTTYFGYRGTLSIKPSVHQQDGGFICHFEKKSREEEIMHGLYLEWVNHGALPELFSDAHVSITASYDSFIQSYHAKPETHQNILYYLYSLEKYAKSGSAEVSKNALLMLIHALCSAKESPTLHIDATNAAAFCLKVIRQDGWTCQYLWNGIPYTLLEWTILENETVALLLLDSHRGPFEKRADGTSLRVLAALNNRHEVANRLRVVNPLLPKSLPITHLPKLKELKTLAFAYYTQRSLMDEGRRADDRDLERIKDDIQRLVHDLGYRDFKSFLSSMPTPYDERMRNPEDTYWFTDPSWHFSLFCEDICESIHRYHTDVPSWTVPDLFWQLKLTFLAQGLHFQALHVIAKKFGLPSFESQREPCLRRAYADHLISLQIEETAKRKTINPLELRARMDDLHLLLQSTEESDAIKYVADQLGCPLFSKFATKPFGLRAAEKMYALQIAEANDNFAGLDRFNLPKDVRHLLSKTLQVKRLHHGRGMEVVPALKFFQDNDMALNHYTAEACALAVTHRLKEAPFNLFHAGLEHRSLIKNIKNRQLSMPTEDKTHLLSFISGACPGEYNPEDMLIRLTELIFNGITVSSFKDDIFTQGELIFPFFGQASMMHTAPYTEQDHILRIQETRNIHERQLLDRLSTEIKAPLEGFTYAHQVMFAYRAKVGGGVEIMPLGDPAYGQNRLIHKPAITHERVLVMGNITNPTYQHNKPMVITSRESIYLLLATFPRDVLNAYLYFLMHGVFPANAKHCERYKPKEVHCDLTITSLGAAAIPLSHLTQATILFNPSRPLSPEANVLLPFVHRISVDIEHSEIFQSKLSRFYQAIDSDNPVTVKRYVETFAFYTRHITTSGDGIAGYAIRHKKYNAAIELLSQGASPFLSNTEGDTALHLIMRTLPSECPSRIRNRLLIMMFTMAKDQAILLLRNMSGQTAFDEATLPHEVTVALEHNQLFKEVHKFLSLRKSVRLTESCPPARVSEVGLFSHTSLKRGRPPENLEVACAASAERLEDKMTESLSKVAREAR